MKTKRFTTYGIVLLTAFLFGCNSSTTSNDNASATTPVETSGDNAHAQRETVLESLVNEADFVFSGTLKSIDFRNSIEGIPSTFATYAVDQVIKGDYKNATFTVDYLGGFFDPTMEKHLSVSNSPEVELNEFSVLMVKQDSDTGCKLVKCEHGRYTLKDGHMIAANESAVLINDNGALKFISKAARKSGAYKGALDEMSVEKFISHLKGIAAKGKGKSNKIIKDVDMNVPFHSPHSLFNASPAPSIDNSVAKSSPRNKQAQGSDFDQWEEAQLQQNAGNPVLTQAYLGENQ